MGAHGSNLHFTIDSEIIEYKGTTLPDVLNSKSYFKEVLEGVKKIDIIGWSKQSRGYLKNVYTVKNIKVDDSYVDTAYPIIKTQLLDASIILSAVLEHYFKPSSYYTPVTKILELYKLYCKYCKWVP